MLCLQCAGQREYWHFTAACRQRWLQFFRTLGCSSSPTMSLKMCWLLHQKLGTQEVSGAKTHLFTHNIYHVMYYQSCGFLCAPFLRKFEEPALWQWSWTDKQNNHIPLWPLQEETASGGLWGSQNSLWTGKLFYILSHFWSKYFWCFKYRLLSHAGAEL